MAFNVGDKVEVNRRVDPNDPTVRAWTPAKVIDRKLSQDRQNYHYRVEFADGVKMLYGAQWLRPIPGATSTPSQPEKPKVEAKEAPAQHAAMSDEYWGYYTGLGPDWREKISRGMG